MIQKYRTYYSLIDCNNFYASCQRVFNSRLRGIPIVVLSNNDGCVIARSEEAKKLGIKMGVPFFQIQEIVRRYFVVVFSANFPLYGDMSKRVMNILSTYSPVQEIYSIDECFLDVSGMQVDLKEYGLAMKAHVGKWTGIPVCVGTAPTKSLAKAANRIAKKFPEHSKGCHIIDTEELRIKALKWLPVDDVWGIGRKWAKRLKFLGVKTAYDFTQLPESWVLKNMTIVGLRLLKDLQGIPSIQMEEEEASKSISVSRTFKTDYSTYDEVKERITTFTALAAEKLRSENLVSKRMTLVLQTNQFKNIPQYSRSIKVKLPYPTSSTLELVDFSDQALNQIFRPGLQYKRAGITLHHFENANELQESFFFRSNPKHQALMEVMDKMNRKYGSNVVRLGSMDEQRFIMRQEHLSPEYTTKLQDIMQVKIM